MQLKPSTIHSFQAVYQQCFGQDIDENEAQIKAVQLLEFINVIYRPVHIKDTGKAYGTILSN